LERLKKENKLEGIKVGEFVSLVVFYGITDWTHSRGVRDASNPNLIPVILPVLFKLFDEAYLYPMPDMASPLLSPGIALDELLSDALPDKLVIINCGGDQLLAETERFRKRLTGLGKKVDGCIVKGVGHGRDKKPKFKKGNVMKYEELAIKSLREVWT
jgi:acetyl esterase/lipase